MLKVVSSLAVLVMAVNSHRHSAFEKHYAAMNSGILSPPLADNSTYGNTEEIHTTHVSLNLTVDFDTRTLSGNAIHNMNVVAPTSVVQFDIWDLTIAGCFNATDYAALTCTISQPNPAIGSVLQVELPREVQTGETAMIGINYTTSATGHAFSWLNAEQTAGGTLPYMFT